MVSPAVKITRKGQITIPKEIREKLQTEAVYFEIEGNVITIKPVKDAAGSLRPFAQNFKPGTSTKKMKDLAWEEAVLEKATGKSS